MRKFLTALVAAAVLVIPSLEAVDSGAAPSKRPRVLTVKELGRSERPTKAIWVEIRARDRNATVVSLEVSDDLGNSFVVDGSCDTVVRGRRKTDGRTIAMNVPIDKRHASSTATIRVRAYSIDCNRPRRQSGDQYGRRSSFQVPIGEL